MKVVFIADMFLKDYKGGAELTTHVFMEHGVFKGHDIHGLHCQVATVDEIKHFENSAEQVHFIIGNFSQLPLKTMMYICKNVEYSIIEYDYKICKYRSFKNHKINEGIECDCLEGLQGKLSNAWYGRAKHVWFMSEGQRQIFLSKVETIKKENTTVLSSAFTEGDLRFIKSLRNNEKNDKYLILGGDNWIKNTSGCIEHAQENNLEHEIIVGLPYHELLIKLSTSKGLIFLPNDNDTCPRLVIEAKLLGCDLILNDHVQHKDEEWFQTEESCYEHLKTRPEALWSFYEQR